MKFKVIILICCIGIISCKNDKSANIEDFKTGTFETFLDDSDATSIATRNDSIQIETYNSKKDTFAIRWVNSFEYVLTKVNPKTTLDNTPFHVKITGIKGDTYTFKASYLGSNFKQTGTATKIE